MPRGTGEGSVRGGAANAAAAAAGANGDAARAPSRPPPLPALLSQLTEVQACPMKGRLASMLQGAFASIQRGSWTRGGGVDAVHARDLTDWG